MRKDHRYRKPDKIQSRVVERLRELPDVDAIIVNAEIDILIGYRTNWIFELKSSRATSHRARGSVREKQADLRARWPGQYEVIEPESTDEDDAVEEVFARILKIIGYRRRKRT